MPVGELFIKYHSGITPVNDSSTEGWIDTYLQWGISFSDTALSAIMTPAPNKTLVENKSRLQDGKRVMTDKQYVKKDERDISIEMYITAKSRTDFMNNYNRFCSEVLDYGHFELKSIYMPDKVYRLTYLNCTQFSEFMQNMAKFVLRLNEPDPGNRSI